MGKVKINSGLAIILLVACLFSDWQTFLLFGLLMLIFCEIDENVKKTVVTVATFKIGISIVSVGWGIIYDLINVGVDGYDAIISLVGKEMDFDTINFLNNFRTLATNVLSIVNGVVSALITLTKLAFVITILTGKKRNENFISKRINNYVSKAVNYVNNINLNNQPNQQTMQQNIQ